LFDFEPDASIPREELLLLLRERIEDAVPASRLIAEGILGAGSRIDFVAVEPSGRLAVLVVGEAGEDLAAIGRALAHRAWVEARLPDWLQLSPQLGASAQAGVCATVLCPSFSEDARVAATALGESTLRLLRYHFLRNGSGLQILVEKPPSPAVIASHGAPAPPSNAELDPVFRTGLSDADLGMTGNERTEFE